ncbi:hypothetical protein SISNIDRAFT_406959 [Sistotremastrum niveocremeum HHB9708]|uniref:DNA-directed RNA polymerase III subunit RPC6 n=1 Tax=Sistotremastrum niveocremeum HHB9708 TaxID=1314777 RepID=A0A164YGW5_9AGAM|nr:hypothetical protein SISNIDRAFT_406959 [Sistotremastrum niveocremeum HHB9708]
MASSSKQGRALTALERKIHEAGLAAHEKILSSKDVQKLAGSPKEAVDAINALLKTGLIKVMTDAKGKVSYKAVGASEFNLKKDMSGVENMVLSQIQAAGNEGIWIKHIKMKTDLHQTIVTRSLKSLEQKQLIKTTKSIKHPTRKLYILYNIDPSVEITGGPWYTDNELDTEFIKMLSSACLRYIRDRSLPKGSLNKPPSERKLYGISSAPAYPSASQVLSFLSRSRITDTELSLEHVEMLLNTLVYDGLVERVPAYGSSLWNAGADDEDDEDEEEAGSTVGKKRKKSSRKADASSDSESGSETEVKSRKKKKAKKDESDTDDEETPKKSKKKISKKRFRDDSDDETETEDRRPAKKSKKSRHRSSDSEESSSEEESRKKSKARSKSKSKRIKALDSASVYRAVHEERVTIASGWNQAPCGRCEQFEFCHSEPRLVIKGVVDIEEGPVNPKNCNYYDDWLTQTIAEDEN